MKITERLNQKTPQITVHRYWTLDDVRTMCIRHDWYTRGTCDEYATMLHFVGVAAEGPTPRNMYLVAEDIWKHSENDMILVSDIMYYLEDECVRTGYEVEGE